MFDNYHRALFTMHDKHERVAGLHDIHEQLSNELFWPLFRLVWQGSESLFLNTPALRDMLTRERICDPERFVAMEKHELDFIKRSARRDAPVKIYRGGSAMNHTGFSWTTRRAVAEQFASLSGANKPTITVGRVPVPNIILYLNGGESEVVALPEHVEVERIVDCDPQPDTALKMRRIQILVQAKGPNALVNLTPAEYFVNEVEHGRLDRAVILNHMKASRKFLEPLGFKTRLKTIDAILGALEAH